MKKVNGRLNISVTLECPECERTIDLMKIPSLTKDDFLYDEVLEGSYLGCEDLGESIFCPRCKTEFKIGAIRW